MPNHPTVHTVDEALDRFQLVQGAGNRESTACVMTAVSWIAGEAWSDSPSCAHPILRNLAVRTNDHPDTTTADRERILREGIGGLLDSWWVPAEVIVAAHAWTGEGDDDRTPLAKCLDVLGAVEWWKSDKQRAYLTGADLTGAYLTGADLRRAYGTPLYGMPTGWILNESGLWVKA